MSLIPISQSRDSFLRLRSILQENFSKISQSFLWGKKNTNLSETPKKSSQKKSSKIFLTKKIVEPKNKFQFFPQFFFENLTSSYDRQRVLGKILMLIENTAKQARNKEFQEHF